MPPMFCILSECLSFHNLGNFMQNRFFAFTEPTKAWYQVIDFLQVFTHGCIIYMVCTVFFDIYQVQSNSMLPALVGNGHSKQGDYIIVQKALFSIKRNDIVVFVDTQKLRFVVKRVVALPEEEVYIHPRTQFLHINGKPFIASFERKYRWNKYDHRTTCPKNGWASKPIKVPKDCYFVCGDNSYNSIDSRMWGWLPRSRIVGKVCCIVFPFSQTKDRY